MLSIKHLHSRKTNNSYTVMIIPGKYGSSKSLVIPKLLIYLLIILSLSLFAALPLFITHYSVLRNQNNKDLDNIKSLKIENSKQQQELENYKKVEDELKVKLEELKEIEDKLKKHISGSVSTNTNISVTAGKTPLDLQQIDTQIQNYYVLIDNIEKNTSINKNIPYILPCSGKISSYFGGRSNPVSRGRSEFHHGVDITNSYRTKIKASADGIVEYAGWLNGYGYAVIINHQNGYTSVYGHNSKLLVKKSQTVKRGQTISLMGSTGRSTGTHVHFEIRLNGVPVNPLKIQKGESYDVQ